MELAMGCSLFQQSNLSGCYDRAGLSCDSPLLCHPSNTECGYKPRSKGLKYSRLRELVLEAFKVIDPDISTIGTHITFLWYVTWINRALALQWAAPKVCVLSCGVYWDLEERYTTSDVTRLLRPRQDGRQFWSQPVNFEQLKIYFPRCVGPKKVHSVYK